MQKPKPTQLATVLITDRQGKLLLMQRANEPFLGLWSLPGGKIKESENPVDAIKREVTEELGITLSDVSEIGCEKYTSPDQAILFVYTSTFDIKTSMNPNKREVQGVQWVSKEELPGLEPFPPNHFEVILKYL